MFCSFQLKVGVVVLSRSASLQSHTNFILIFTLVSKGLPAINCVPGWERGGSVGCTQQGRQARLGTAVPRGRRNFLTSLPTWFPRILISEDVSHLKKGGLLQDKRRHKPEILKTFVLFSPLCFRPRNWYTAGFQCLKIQILLTKIGYY